MSSPMHTEPPSTRLGAQSVWRLLLPSTCKIVGGIDCQREKGRRVVREFGVVVTMNVSAVWEKMKGGR